MRAGGYESVVVDTVGELYRIVLEDLSNRDLHPKIQMYGDTGTHVERFCRALVEMPINAIFVAHEFKEKDENSGEIDHRPYTGTKNPVLGEKLMAMVDVIGYTGVAQEVDSEEVRYLAQLITGKGRKGGDRFGVLGPSREVDLTAWMQEIRESMETPKKKKSQTQKGAA